MSGTMVKASELELLDRIDFIAQMLGAEMPEWLIREKSLEKFGVCRRQVNSYIARARVLMREKTGKNRFEHRIESDSFYRSEMQRSADPAIRIRCRERLDSIHGVDARYEGGPAEAPPSQTIVNVTINVAGLSSDQIEELVERGEALDPKSIEHLPRADRLRILRKAAQVMGPKETRQ